MGFMKKHYDILDFDILKPGIEIRCCLDWENLKNYPGEDGEADGELHWWNGTIIERSYSEEYECDILFCEVPELRSQDWGVILVNDHIKYIKISIQEWDD